ncbi:hypothetical protein [Sphingomonas sp.]|uniref:hypothetical protein n=1 Tax=Sphingomonas sp. TaxID=28214 RepID=UPI0025CB9AC6|nr:hypothetical protein [Sphingomonas sp.]MBV9527649.1 hypothetical protein [Sphingomonas sp.]
MTRLTPAVLLLASFLAACSAPGGPFPSLQPRAAETVDPRLPVDRPMNDRPVSSALAAALNDTVARAHAGESAFAPLMASAEQLAGNAGAPHGEGWIAAQEALTAAIAARRMTATALADIDGLGGERLQAQGGMTPADLAAIQAAQSEVGAIDQRQQDRVDAVRKRLGP